MRPLPEEWTERCDGRKVPNPRRAGSPEAGQPIRPIREALRSGCEGTPNHPRTRGPAPRQSGRPSGRGESSGGENPRKASTAGFLTEPGAERTRREVEALKTRVSGRGRERQEGRDSERGTHRVEGKALKGEAQERSGASRAGRPTGHAAKGVPNPARGARATVGRPPIQRIRRSEMCCRARKPRRGSLVPLRVRSRTRIGDDVGPRQRTSEGTRNAQGGSLDDLGRSSGPVADELEGRPKRRTSRTEPDDRPGRPDPNPRSAARTPREGEVPPQDDTGRLSRPSRL